MCKNLSSEDIESVSAENLPCQDCDLNFIGATIYCRVGAGNGSELIKNCKTIVEQLFALRRISIKIDANVVIKET